MAGKCDDCGRWYEQFQAVCAKNEDGVFQTRRYYRCPKCGTVYVEVDPPQDEFYHDGEMRVEKYPVVSVGPVTLDRWL